MTEINWLASGAVSALYAAAAVARGQVLTDSRLAQALAPPVEKLLAGMSAAGLAEPAFWRHAVPLAGTTENDHDLADQIVGHMTGTRPTEEMVARLAGALRDVRQAFDRARPDAVRELTLRTGPLRELWEARGPGHLAAIRRFTEPAVIVQRALVYAVPPIAGGGGEAYASEHAVAIEAVLANPHAALPEVVRLGWLVARLGSDALGAASGIAPSKLSRLVAVATLMPALAAAEWVELAAFDIPTIALALRAWQGVKPEDADDQAATLDRWWRTYSEERPSWAAALESLDRMLKTT
ncbi:MAG TPA: hypothetical protein VHD36_01160 [Pirellulales bacterium]|nr:hypothetical protein [Pirellulales bacterium]